ncbi:hypothetical protein A3K29_04725 [Candidatus Collierbacteria bacterium RIFOXYB2_FULL_46_14]|uniref:Uncharacterized protein n=1 Tax=Candidatus Collierbacteria bacterium GW2011_GWA2_46_26 TaxID=1618381 RepID=A0A0G1PJZ4_9BACT|nr:MAG: hypothetical protein UW29_C0005G0047 [Candidatus Collierbacteria bacterium GW2011_GWC2_44_13]KKU33119.1 MAG: hypothetical protein UX47_C0006G0090 [Candidatus Collierbacteria bacterium GW2011_GWA2_46_26]OGD73402.1 MAG: hypothetical protein A3K29_04725 [Candidatus Collierbacteria bacterium RIFOXYB2_FULL_46_14]OGD76444.1 MAG: hypothetical protein A3K43_04725 [Candidatus Collierbacteria bacterium RIFOXYA2_FULL_46_20]OGD77780.1 MAG: hypothetical protein A3K39_04725 [Candidatus Collierbacteri
MKSISNFCFTVTLTLVICSLLAPLAGLQITTGGAILNGLMFVAACIFAGFNHKGERQTLVLINLCIATLVNFGSIGFLMFGPWVVSNVILVIAWQLGSIIYAELSYSRS